MKHTTPTHYKSASKQGKKYLIILLGNGPRSKCYKSDLCTAAEKHFPWLLQDSYLFNACKYLWRLGAKSSDESLFDRLSDERKALNYLQLWLDYYGLYHDRGQQVQQVRDQLKARIEEWDSVQVTHYQVALVCPKEWTEDDQ